MIGKICCVAQEIYYIYTEWWDFYVDDILPKWQIWPFWQDTLDIALQIEDL